MDHAVGRLHVLHRNRVAVDQHGVAIVGYRQRHAGNGHQGTVDQLIGGQLAGDHVVRQHGRQQFGVGEHGVERCLRQRFERGVDRREHGEGAIALQRRDEVGLRDEVGERAEPRQRGGDIDDVAQRRHEHVVHHVHLTIGSRDTGADRVAVHVERVADLGDDERRSRSGRQLTFGELIGGDRSSDDVVQQHRVQGVGVLLHGAQHVQR